jgi:NitT/TauT family transport system substrate-binding protein
MNTISRRQCLLFLGAGAAGLVVSACGQAAAPASSAPAAKPAASTAGPAASSAPAKPAASAAASASAAAKPGSASSVKITDIQITSAAGSYIAAEKGYFKDEGIQAEFVKMGSGDQIPAVVSGTADVAGTAIAAALYNAFARELPLKMVADHGANLKDASAGGFVIRKDVADKFNGPASIKGWKVANGLTGGTPDVAMARWLKTVGLTLKDIDMVNMNFPDMIPAFSNKAIDAAYYQEPFTTIAANQGVAVRGPIGYDIYPDQQIAVVLFGAKMTADKELSLHYLRAYLRGVRDYVKALIQKDKPSFDQVVPILIQHTTVKDPMLFDKAIPSGLKPDAIPNVESMKDALAYFVGTGDVKQQFDLDKYIDLSFIREANQQLGPFK